MIKFTSGVIWTSQISSVNEDGYSDYLWVNNFMSVLHFLVSLPAFQDLYIMQFRNKKTQFHF